MAELSLTTGQPFYSGSYTSIRDICRSLNIGEGKLAKVTQELVNDFQEMVDREIDAQLSNYYYTPIKPYNVKMPDGITRSVFPGNVQRLAKYWSAGLLLMSEFQGSEPNVQEAAEKYVEDSRKMMYSLSKFEHRIFGQDMKSAIRTMPPNFQPPMPVESQV